MKLRRARGHDDGQRMELPPETEAALVEAGYKGKLGPMAHNTLVHRLAVLSKAHQMRDVKKNPCQDPKVRELPKKKAAMTKDPLSACWPPATIH